ncbi:hypothetical protein O4J56_23950 [Nocardiopsis sp. RSe5-2]|uniref:Thioesterase family protein n=1 Tax=Nocardiopsis endophytica TaxID=3018445 RepID=A0ABT4U9S9_9ACTN|nr:hypothetical protein [Nocardiopsis endophytica]MDA2813719.1 hypothetical protein [Nocardiopsis endophytica]
MSVSTGDEAPAKLTVGRRFNGPPGSANGGYLAGLLARRVGTPAVRVTLRTPPPLETPMEVDPGGGDAPLRLLHGDTLVAEAQPAEAPATDLRPVSPETAAEASRGFRGRAGHPFATCFVCGNDRAEGDGLRVLAGPVPGADGGLVAAPWTPDASLAGDTPRTAGPEFAWAALDCPGGWASDVHERPMVLGRMAAEVVRLPEIGKPHVVMGRLLRTEGRKVFTATALFDHEGARIASAEATWIIIDPKDFGAAG